MRSKEAIVAMPEAMLRQQGQLLDRVVTRHPRVTKRLAKIESLVHRRGMKRLAKPKNEAHPPAMKPLDKTRMLPIGARAIAMTAAIRAIRVTAASSCNWHGTKNA